MGGAGAFVETIEIDVIKLQTSSVRIYQSEGRTGDVLFSDTQSRADTFDENSLARSKWTTQ